MHQKSPTWFQTNANISVNISSDIKENLEENGAEPIRYRGRIKRRRGVYLLPNLLTISGLFAGFFAIISAVKGSFEEAIFSIFVAMIMDFFDGRLARLTKTQTAFGAELDSLSDMVSFGVAPALLAYLYSLFHLSKGWLAAFLFVAAGALRLARFSAQVDTTDKRYFQGLPIPTAAGVLASTIWLDMRINIEKFLPISSIVDRAIVTLIILTAILMVSNIRYHSFKQITFRGRVPFIWTLIVAALFPVILIDPPDILFSFFLGYTLWGPGYTLWSLHKTRSLRKKGLVK